MFRKMPAVTDDGWCEWIAPLPGYLAQCCGCGLVHELQFNIARQTSPTREDGTWDGENLSDPTLRVEMRARIVESAKPISKARR